jgi:DUF4097 and DUF4098 domain-containing protein YvlB
MRNRDQQRMFWIVGIFIVIVLMLTATAIWLLQDKSSEKTKPIIFAKNIPANQIQNISIDSDMPEVILLPNNSTNIQIRYSTYSKEAIKNIITQINKNELYVNVREKESISTNFHHIHKKSILELRIPANQLENLQVRTTIGGISIRPGPWEMDHVTLRSINGKVEIHQLKGITLKVNTIAGDQKLHQIRTIENIDLTSAEGLIEINQLKSRNLVVKTVTGNMKLEKIDSKAKLETTSGTLQPIHFQNLHDGSTIHSLTGNLDISLSPNNKHIILDAKTSTGTFQVDFPDYDELKKSEKHRKITIGNKAKAKTLQISTASGNLYLHYSP